MTTASVTVRIDEKTKEAAASIVEDFGFDLFSGQSYESAQWHAFSSILADQSSLFIGESPRACPYATTGRPS